jgi:hypothetical protein
MEGKAEMLMVSGLTPQESLLLRLSEEYLKNLPPAQVIDD